MWQNKEIAGIQNFAVVLIFQVGTAVMELISILT